MTLHVFDQNFTYKGRIENWISLTWSEEFQDEGNFTLMVNDTNRYAQLLQRGYYFYRKDRPGAMMAVRVERDIGKGTITVNGHSTIILLDRRVVRYEYKVTNVESGIYGMVQENLRGLPNIAFAQSKGLTAESETSFEATEMLKSLFTLCEAGDVGLRMLFDYTNKKHTLEVYPGVDRTYQNESGSWYIFSTEFGSMNNLKIVEDDDVYKNAVFVHAVNSDEAVFSQDIGTATGLDRRETIIRGEDRKTEQTFLEWVNALNAKGYEKLHEYQDVQTFELEPATALFGEKFELGDKVTCNSKRHNVRFNTRITGYKYTSDRNGEKVTLTIGNKDIDYVKGAILKHG